LIALHHLFSFAGLKDECRNRIKSSGSDDAIVSEKIKKINLDNKNRFRYPDGSSVRLIGASKCWAALSRRSSKSEVGS
jgi:hypothetical protein